MNKRLHLVFSRSVVTMAVAAGVSFPCAAQYGVTYGPADPPPRLSTEQVQQAIAMLAELEKLNRLIAELDLQMAARCSDQSGLLSSRWRKTPDSCTQLLQPTSREPR